MHCQWTTVAIALSLLPLTIGAQALRPGGRAPTTIITGGKVFTADTAALWAEAIAIRGERIVAVGTTAAIERMAGSATRRIVLHGEVVIPGINDAHVHLGYGAAIAPSTPFTPNVPVGPSSRLVRDSLAAFVARYPKGTWLRGEMGLAIRRDTTLRRAALDSIAPQHPVMLAATYGHGSMVNSAAMARLGLANRQPDPAGGWYERDARGELTGLLDGSTQVPVWDAFAAANTVPLIAHLEQLGRTYASWGVTSVQQMSSGMSPVTVRRTFGRADLRMRVRVIAWPAPDRRAAWRAVAGRQLAPLVNVSGVKMVVDGTPIENWALMRSAYPGRPDWYGRAYYAPDSVRTFLQRAIAEREQPMLHVVGDSTMVLVLHAMQQVAPDSVWRTRRLRLEHANGLTSELAAVARRLGVIVSQPRGPAEQLVMWERAGVTVAYGSDAEPANPFQAMMGWTTPVNNAPVLTRESAILRLTRDPAFAEFAERQKGTLSVGKLADLAVLSQDVFTVPAAQLPQTRSVLTLLGGRIVHDQRSTR
jgi:predicted amidohydrolase YtcJ